MAAASEAASEVEEAEASAAIVAVVALVAEVVAEVASDTSPTAVSPQKALHLAPEVAFPAAFQAASAAEEVEVGMAATEAATLAVLGLHMVQATRMAATVVLAVARDTVTDLLVTMAIGAPTEVATGVAATKTVIGTRTTARDHTTVAVGMTTRESRGATKNDEAHLDTTFGRHWRTAVTRNPQRLLLSATVYRSSKLETMTRSQANRVHRPTLMV